MNLVFVIGIVLLVVGTAYIMSSAVTPEEQSESLYQGPVPEGYDEYNFRKTGITFSETGNSRINFANLGEDLEVAW